MARITLRQLLDHAAEHDYAVPAHVQVLAHAAAVGKRHKLGVSIVHNR